MGKSLTIFILTAVVFCPLLTASAGTAPAPPGVVTLGSISDRFEPVIFNHQLHAMMAGDCGTCHHQHGDNESLPCSSCHAIEKSVFRNSVVNSFLACKMCHASNNDPATPEISGLKVAYHNACFKCHRGMGNIGKDPKSCSEGCHALKKQTASAGGGGY